jgi:hypothetical protein
MKQYDLAKYNKNILDLWERFSPEDRGTRMPWIYHKPIKEGGILFVGMNPSFTKKWQEKYQTDYEYNRNRYEQFVSWERSIVVEKPREDYPYYKKLDEIAHACNLSWSDIELFAIRETNQNQVKEMLINSQSCHPGNDFVAKMSDFARKSLDIAVSILKEVRPKCVVVINAFGSDVLKWYFKEKNGKAFLFSEHYGTYLLDGSIPVFLSGMLSGQRALDKHSYRRLKWHIEKVIKEMSSQ